MPTGYPKRGRRYKYAAARKYLRLRSELFNRLIEAGKLPPDGKLGMSGERYWYADTLDKSPIKGILRDKPEKTP